MDLAATLQSRLVTYGWIGDYLLTLLEGESCEEPPAVVGDQIPWVGRMTANHGPLIGAACSLLYCKFPVQVDLSDMDIGRLAAAWMKRANVERGDPDEGMMMVDSPDHRKENFPIKVAHPGATNKVNVYFEEILRAYVGRRGAAAYEAYAWLPALRGLYDDQMSAWLIYADALSSSVDKSLELSAGFLLYPKQAKSFSVALKSVGANGSLVGAKLVEGDTLQGRGVAPLDLLGEAKTRCSPELVAAGLARVGMDKLRAAIRAVIAEELRVDRCEFKTMDEFWDSRWAWCVNGSHGKALERAKPQYKVGELPGITNYYRRVFAENTTSNPLPGWDGETYVSASPKLEHGKTRAIFACDTMNYFAFEHLMSGIERAWQGRRVVLNPGRGGTVGMVARIKKLQKMGSIDIMLDYDDFNSQHSLDAQKMVIAETVDLSGYPASLGERLVDSFDKMHIYVGDKLVGVAAGTLMSGHRCTTYINSILNAAYIRASVAPGLYERSAAMHVGDDVYIRSRSFGDCASLVDSMAESGCRMNPAKQSIGCVTAEFLRTAVRPRWATGYLARSVSSIVSGNWVSEVRQEGVSALQSMMQSARTLANRSQTPGIVDLITESVARMTGLKARDIEPLLAGRIGLNGGPVFSSSGMYREAIVKDETSVEDEDAVARLPCLATVDYLSKCATDVEVHALVLTGKTVKSAMLLASYKKSLASGKRDLVEARLNFQQPRCLIGSIDVLKAVELPDIPGALSPYPLLQLLKNRLTVGQVMELLRYVGVAAPEGRAMTAAWGAENTPTCIQGYIPFADACSFAKRTVSGVIYTTFPYYT